jgi:xanthine dehydrogenase small subunit
MRTSKDVSSAGAPIFMYSNQKPWSKTPDEFIEKISFNMPSRNSLFHFEKVSKRTCLDIASVNTAIQLRMSGGYISEAHLSAGGVGPIPAYLEATSHHLTGKAPDPDTIAQAIDIARSEISPISDVRGSADYKRLLLGQLIKAHFLTLFPEIPVEEIV